MRCAVKSVPYVTIGAMAVLFGLLTLCTSPNTVPQAVIDKCNLIALGAPGAFNDCIREELSR